MCGEWLEPFTSSSKPPWHSRNHHGGGHAGGSASEWWGPKPGETSLEYVLALAEKLDPKVCQAMREAAVKAVPAPPPPTEQPKDLWQTLSQAKFASQKKSKELLKAE